MGSVYFDRHKGRWVAKAKRKGLEAKDYAPSREEAEALLPLLEAQIGLRAPEWTLKAGRRLVRYAHTEVEARQKLRELEREAGLKAPDLILEEAFKRLLSRNLKPRTKLDYRNLVQRYLSGRCPSPSHTVTSAPITGQRASRAMLPAVGSRT